MFADWSDRIKAGEVPPQPPRPQGVERNIVLSQWEWGGPNAYIHDEVATDKRKPTINANGKIYGVDLANDQLTWVDPKEGRAGVRAPGRAAGHAELLPAESHRAVRRTTTTR